jgi:hypothetical protein
METEDERIEDYPYLRLYDEDEHQLRRWILADSDSQTTETSNRGQFDTRLFVAYRFFGIIKGFHEAGVGSTCAFF